MLKFFKQSANYQKYLSNTSWLVAERVIRLTVVLLVGIYVARYLGPDRFGLLNYAHSFVGLFSAIATVGLDGIVVRELVKQSERDNLLLGTAFVLRLGGTIVMCIAIALSVQMTSNNTYTNLLVTIIAVGTFFQTLNVIDFSFQSKVQSKFVVFAQLIQLFISAISKLFLIWIEASLIWFASVILLDAITLAAGLIWIYHKQANKIESWRWDSRIAWKLLKDSWPLILSGLVISIYMKIDQVMIKEMLDNQAVGHYAAAVKLSTAWYFVPIAITSSLFPAIVNAKQFSTATYHSRIQKLFDFMVWISVGIAIPTTFLAEWVIAGLFGDSYLPAAGVLKIHIWAGVFVFLGVASSKWVLSENLTIFSFYRTLGGAIINVILNYFFIPEYGIQGAAFATLISQIVASTISYAATKRTMPIFSMQIQAIIFFHVLKNILPFYKKSLFNR